MVKWCLRLGLGALLGPMALMAWANEPVAVVRQSQGKVFVSQGSAMTPAHEGMSLYGGNRVVVAGGQAEIVYSDGCVVTLSANSLLAVKGGAAQCGWRQAQARATGGFRKSLIGQGGALPSTTVDDGMIADLRRPTGGVLVDQKGREIPGRHNMSVRRDDRLVTAKDGNVIVSFRGCEVQVGPQQRVTVDDLRARCQEGVVLTDTNASSEVAIVKRPQGAVTVDSTAARHDMGVNNNSRIITGAGSSVTVIFKACEVEVDENEDVQVKNLISKCKGGFWVDTGAGGAAGVASAGGSTVGITGVGVGFTGPLIIGGALGASVIGAISANNDDRCASPPCR